MKATTTSPTTLGRLFLQEVGEIVLARHAKAPKTSPDQKDEDRFLNDIGSGQAKKLGLKLQSFEFDDVLTSPLLRVRETLVIATYRRIPYTEVPELTCPTDGVHPIDVMFNAPDMGYVPLAKYFEHPLGEHLKTWGRTALEAVVTSISMKPGQKVLVGGHAVLQNALLWAIAEACREAGAQGTNYVEEMALQVGLGDAEAFHVTVYPPDAGGDWQLDSKHLTLD